MMPTLLHIRSSLCPCARPLPLLPLHTPLRAPPPATTHRRTAPDKAHTRPALLTPACTAAVRRLNPTPPPAPGPPAQVWSGLVAWAVHLLVARVILRAMSLPSSVPWVELAAYTGYTFVPVVASVVAGQLGGRWAYYGAWLYGSLCMAVFMVRTMKRVIFQEARGYGESGVGGWLAGWGQGVGMRHLRVRVCS